MNPTSDHDAVSDHAPLGSNTKFASTIEDLDPIALRYYLQNLARQLLPETRLRVCMRVIKRGRNTVDIIHNPQTHKARYKGLMRCASIWNCPVCAAQITEKRRVELSSAVHKSGLSVVMITYTLRHRKSQALGAVLTMLLSAYESHKGGRGIVDIKTELHWLGSVKALEVTYGDHGWHPHIHELAFFPNISPDQVRLLESEFRARWMYMVEKFGGNANWSNGVDVKSSEAYITEYIAKFGRTPKEHRWNVEHELTKAPTKRGRKFGRTPIELLIDYGAGDAKSGALFQEYAIAFKGKSQLQWSRGMRALLGLGDEQKDGTLLNEFDEHGAGIILASLTPAQWLLVITANKRGELLKVANAGDENLVWEFLYNLETVE